MVERRDANRNAWIRVSEVPADTLTCTATKLVEGNQYYIRVSAINDIDQGPSTELTEPVTAKCPYGKSYYDKTTCISHVYETSIHYFYFC